MKHCTSYHRGHRYSYFIVTYRRSQGASVYRKFCILAEIQTHFSTENYKCLERLFQREAYLVYDLHQYLLPFVQRVALVK